jgi:hypothetical protein
MRSVVFAIIAAMLPSYAAAESSYSLGTTVIDGREIQLFSDFTWRFADTSEPAVSANRVGSHFVLMHQ